MTELADVQDLGSCAARRVGSTPTTRTSSSQATYRLRRVFHFIAKLIARSFCYSSLPNRTRCRWAPIWVRRFAADLSRYGEISSLTVPSTSEQSPLCSDAFLCLRQKRRHPPAPLLLLCSSFPTATRCAGLAVGGPPCGRHFSSLRSIDFNPPFQLVASVISLVTSFSFPFITQRAHFAAPRFQIGPAVLDFSLGPPLRGRISLS